ncbi:ubiquitin carboxyl-terminal hydrolase (macronuclear) [Tetrahymena thermophila SB210]|uniref:Ubiquitin carboxyl-terminal hydrolase n=1 Tax=Tetrahymena thermophila (strain SB210) TaxID=312017 RepID=I7MHY2_TETTS|nr:ubiquitin carboxyl-terminal hydrolase [Tetrahymena thermophila SB210]EAS03741.2 ubiquitin carboxyl-terminal hydrolase [Tetrahymena thermophila SB210]|eukprot:XP_001023986.2 ubiquitin carboxyl-terminal hydrolase [Tetrahymena thermophila SB210]
MSKQLQSATQIVSNNLSRRQSDNISKKGSKDRNIQQQKVTKHLNHNSYNTINCQGNLNNLSHQNTLNLGQKHDEININNCINDFFVDQSFSQNRKTRSNSCAGAVKSNQRQKQLQNQDYQSKYDISTKDKEYAAIELYNYVKSNIEKSILNEFDTFQDIFLDSQYCQFNEKDLLQNIKQLIEIHFIQSKASEKELKEKHEQECDSYDKNLQRLEAQIREHIRIQQELKLYLESSQIKCQEQEEQIKNLEKVHAQQTDFLEKVCEQMQQQLEIKDSTIKEMTIQISQLKQEISVLKENQTQKSAQNIPKSKIQNDYHYYSKQLINNLSNQRSQTESSSQRKIKLNTPTNIQLDSNNLVYTDQSLLEDKENNQTQANQMHLSLYKSIKTSNKEEISPEKKIQTIIQQQKQQDSQQKQQIRNQEQALLFNEKKSQIKQIQEKAPLLKAESVNDQKIKKKDTMNGEATIQNNGQFQPQQQIIYQQPNFEKQNTSNLQAQSSISNNNSSSIQIKSNRNIPSNLESKYSTTIESKYSTAADTKQNSNQNDLPKNFQEKMIQASKKIKEYIQLQSAREKNNPNNRQQLLNRLKHFSMKNSRAPSISNQNKLIQYFYEKFEDKLEKNPSERSNIKQKMKTLQQISDRRYSTINHKTEESEIDKKIIEQKKSQRHNRSNSFNIGSQQHSSSNYTESKQIESKFAKKQKNFIPINSTQSSHNNMSNSGLVTNNYNLNQIGHLNTNSSNISNFVVNNSFCNWNKRRESVFNQSGTNNNISFQLEGAQKIITNNNYIDESSDSFENFIKDNFILTNNSTENLKTLEL